MSKLNEMVKEFRLSINQSPEALAMMLKLTLDEYEKLEIDWIPSDDILKLMCSLFEWNFSDIQRMARNTPAASTTRQQPNNPEEKSVATPKEPSSFNEMLRDARLAVEQSPEAVAMFLNISVEYYETFENTAIPQDELLRKICALFSWNYNETRQSLINQSTPRMGASNRPISIQDARNKLPPINPSNLLTTKTKPDTLSTRLQEARQALEQPPEAVALLLNISPEYYLELESGHTPEPELLKHIAALFRWNYNELRLLVYNENIQSFQPTVTQLEISSSKHDHKFHSLQEEIKKHWKQMNSSQQEMLLSQLEVLRDTIKRWLS